MGVLSICKGTQLAYQLHNVGVKYVVYWDWDVKDAIASVFAVWFAWWCMESNSQTNRIDHVAAFIEAQKSTAATAQAQWGNAAFKMTYRPPSLLTQSPIHQSYT